MGGSDRDAIQQRTQALNHATQHLAEITMNRSIREALAGKNVKDVEYRTVRPSRFSVLGSCSGSSGWRCGHMRQGESRRMANAQREHRTLNN